MTAQTNEKYVFFPPEKFDFLFFPATLQHTKKLSKKVWHIGTYRKSFSFLVQCVSEILISKVIQLKWGVVTNYTLCNGCHCISCFDTKLLWCYFSRILYGHRSSSRKHCRATWRMKTLCPTDQQIKKLIILTSEQFLCFPTLPLLVPS